MVEDDLNGKVQDTQGQSNDEIAALAKGGKTNVLGFILRLAARIPFLFIIGWLYTKEDVGRFAYAVLVVEFTAQLSAIGLRRGLAELLSNDDREPANVIVDGLFLGLLASSIGVIILVAFPQIMLDAMYFRIGAILHRAARWIDYRLSHCHVVGLDSGAHTALSPLWSTAEMAVKPA
jgi:hypothetical protein